jgi:hypothetical protein
VRSARRNAVAGPLHCVPSDVLYSTTSTISYCRLRASLRRPTRLSSRERDRAYVCGKTGRSRWDEQGPNKWALTASPLSRRAAPSALGPPMTARSADGRSGIHSLTKVEYPGSASSGLEEFGAAHVLRDRRVKKASSAGLLSSLSYSTRIHIPAHIRHDDLARRAQADRHRRRLRLGRL